MKSKTKTRAFATESTGNKSFTLYVMCFTYRGQRTAVIFVAAALSDDIRRSRIQDSAERPAYSVRLSLQLLHG